MRLSLSWTYFRVYVSTIVKGQRFFSYALAYHYKFENTITVQTTGEYPKQK